MNRSMQMNNLNQALTAGLAATTRVHEDYRLLHRVMRMTHRKITLQSAALLGESPAILRSKSLPDQNIQDISIHEALKQLSSLQERTGTSQPGSFQHPKANRERTDLQRRFSDIFNKLQAQRASEREVDKLFVDLLGSRGFQQILATWGSWKDVIRDGTDGARLEQTRTVVLIAWVCTQNSVDMHAPNEALKKLFHPLRPPKKGKQFQNLIRTRSLSVEETKTIEHITSSLEEQDLRPNSPEFIHGVDNLVSKFRADALQAIYTRAQSHPISLDSRSYHRFAEGFLRIGRPASSRRVLTDMHKARIPIELTLWNALLHHAGKMRNTADISSLWTSITETCVPDTALYTSLIDAFFSCAQVDKALEAFQAMTKSSQSLPNSITCNTVVKGLVNNHRSIAALEFVKDTAEPAGMKTDTTTYNLLLNAFLRDGNTEKANMIGGIMRTAQLRDVATYAILLDYYAAQSPTYDNFIKKSNSVLSQMVVENVKPNAHLYSTMMKAVLFSSSTSSGSRSKLMPDTRARAQAQSWLDEMKSNSIARTVLIYELLIRAHFASNDVSSAFKTWTAMRRDQIAPDAGAYTTMISGLIDTQMLPAAVQLFHKGIASGVRRESISLRLLNAAVKANNEAIAKELLLTMSQNDFDLASRSMQMAVNTAQEYFSL